MRTDTQKIITGLVATAVIAGGVIIGFKDEKKPKLTYEEAQMLIRIYNYELEKSDRTLTGVKGDVIQKMNEKFSAREIKTEEDFDEKMNQTDYLILRSGLMKKSK